jgi:hypothetical protein
MTESPEIPETTKFNSLQISMLRLFEQGVDQADTLAIRRLLMDYFDQKLQAELNSVTAQKGYTDADYRRMLHDDSFAAQ